MKKILIALLLPCPLLAQDTTSAIVQDPPMDTFQSITDFPGVQMAWDRSNVTGVVDDDDSTDSHTKKFIQFRSISFYGAGDFYRDGFEDRTIFQQAAPNSTIAFADVSGYTNWDNSVYYMSTSANTTMGMNLNLHLHCQKKFGELRVGFSHSAISVASQYYSQEYRETTDTTALPGGQIMFTDSVAISSYSLNWNANLLQLHVGWIVRSDPKRWLSFYTGVGFSGGLGYNGIIAASHEHYSYLQHSAGPPNGMSYTTNSRQIVQTQEKFKAPMFTSFGIYMPVGMNIRLGTRNNVFKHIMLFGEYNGALLFLNPQGTNTKIRTVSAMQGGVRWHFHAPGKPKGREHKNGQRLRRGYSHGEEHMQVD